MRIKTGVVLVLMFMLAQVAASYQVEFVVYGPEQAPYGLRMQIIENNSFYNQSLMATFNYTMYNLSIPDVYNGPLPHILVASLPDNFHITITGPTNISKNISLCNYNGKCEPCLSGICSHMENALTCSDCKHGGKDGLCEAMKKCDPDCIVDYGFSGKPVCATSRQPNHSTIIIASIIGMFLALAAFLVAGIRKSKV